MAVDDYLIYLMKSLTNDSPSSDFPHYGWKTSFFVISTRPSSPRTLINPSFQLVF